MNTLVTTEESARLAKLESAARKADADRQQIQDAIVERESRWSQSVQAVNDAEFYAREAAAAVAWHEQQIIELNGHARAVLGTNKGEYFRIAREAAAFTATVPVLETIAAEKRALLAEAVAAARSVAKELNVPKASWPSALAE